MADPTISGPERRPSETRLPFYVHHTQKVGESPRSNQDVAIVSPHGSTINVVAADGASAGWDSGWWAWILANNVLRSLEESPDAILKGDLTAPVDRAREFWSANQRVDSSDQIKALYTRAKAESSKGAATLLAASISHDTNGVRVEGTVVGDTMIVAIDQIGATQQSRIHVAPVAVEFGSSPEVVYSAPSVRDVELADAETFGWHLSPNAVVLVMSDGLAEWAFREAERDLGAWTLLANLTPSDFAKLVAGLVETNQMVNDDVTLIQVHPGVSTARSQAGLQRRDVG